MYNITYTNINERITATAYDSHTGRWWYVTDNAVYSSADRVNWSEEHRFTAMIRTPQGFDVRDGIWVVGGTSLTNSDNSFIVSNFNSATLDGIILGTANRNHNIRSIDCNDQIWIAVGANNAAFSAPISDLTSWTRIDVVDGRTSDDDLNRVLSLGADSDSGWLLTGDGGRIYYNSNNDATGSWSLTQLSFEGRQNGGSIAYNGTTAVCIHGAPYISYSLDNINWISTNFSRAIRDVDWVGNRFIAIGDNNYILESTDGITWTNVETTGTIFSPSFASWNGNIGIAVARTLDNSQFAIATIDRGETTTIVNVDSDSRFHNAVVGDKSTGSRFTVIWNLPAGLISDRFYYFPQDLRGIQIESIEFLPSRRQIIMNCVATQDDLSLNTIRMGFPVENGLYDDAPTQLFSIIAE